MKQRDLNTNELEDLQQSLLKWFKEHQRKLPWRENYEPYQVWISEIMLQQTQVKTMLPFYRRWMEALPGIREVAEADEELLIKLWEGLGYYRRVRNIRKTAEMICNEYGGQFPEQVAGLLKLPGIGRYPAGAIASIAFNKPAPILDEDRASASTRRCREGTLEAPRSLHSKRGGPKFQPGADGTWRNSLFAFIAELSALPDPAALSGI